VCFWALICSLALRFYDSPNDCMLPLASQSVEHPLRSETIKACAWILAQCIKLNNYTSNNRLPLVYFILLTGTITKLSTSPRVCSAAAKEAEVVGVDSKADPMHWNKAAWTVSPSTAKTSPLKITRARNMLGGGSLRLTRNVASGPRAESRVRSVARQSAPGARRQTHAESTYQQSSKGIRVQWTAKC